MKPFFQFRLWLKRGPATERFLALGSAAVALVLLAYVSIPSAGTGASDATEALSGPAGTAGQDLAVPADGAGSETRPPGSAGGALPGQPVPAGPAGAAQPERTRAGQLAAPGEVGSEGSPAARNPGRTPAAGGGASPEAGGSSGTSQTGGCSDSGAKAVGVSSRAIRIGVILLDLGQLNSFVGVPSLDDQKKAYRAILASYNGKGGVRCRQLVPTFYADNPLDASGEQATCLKIVEDGVFAVVNNLGGAQSLTCLPQRRVPGVWYTPPTSAVMKQFAPYVLSHMPDYDRLIADYVVGARRYHFFDGMKKLGVIETSCVDDQNKALARELAKAGIAKGAIEVYNYGCPTAVSSPDQDQAAALQFQRKGVTHVMNTAYTYITGFAQAAERQGYKPHYAIMEDGAMAAISYTRPPPVASFDQTLAITNDQVGAENTKGLSLSPATRECGKIMKSVGLVEPTTPGAEAGALYGSGCATVKIFVEALTHAPVLGRDQLAAGIARAGALDLSFPPGPMQVTSPSVPTGGQFYRGARWYTSCQCWRVIDKTFHPGA